MSRWQTHLRDRRGAAAAEFALWTAALALPVLSTIDLATFAVRRLQVVQAGDAAAAAAWRVCDTAAKLPATQNCPDLAQAVLAAAQATPLGEDVRLAEGSPQEGFFCVTADGDLQPASATWTIGDAPASEPADCSTVEAGSAARAARYISVTVTYDYAPLFGAASVVRLLPTRLTQTAWRRLA